MAIATSGIDHVHLSVTDIEAFIARFSSILDCESKIPLYIDSIQALNSMNSLNLDVFEPKEREGIAARQMAGFGGPGLTTLSMLVEDIDAATTVGGYPINYYVPDHFEEKLLRATPSFQTSFGVSIF